MSGKLSLEQKKNKIGLKFSNKHGEIAEIIEYNSYRDVKIKFIDDGEVRECVNMSSLKRGNFQRNSLIGLRKSKAEIKRMKNTIYKNKQGYEAKIIVYRNYNDVDLVFLVDGSVIQHKTMNDINRGSFLHIDDTDLSNLQIGKLHVIKNTGLRTRNGIALWECECECGNKSYFSSKELITRRSCGCKKIKNEIEIVGLNRVISTYKRNAKNRNIEWDLNNEEVKNIIKQPCFYCGSINSNTIQINSKYLSENHYKYNGIDRVDSSKGYVKGNVVPCCKICNIAKHNMDKNDFLNWIDKVYNHVLKQQ